MRTDDSSEHGSAREAFVVALRLGSNSAVVGILLAALYTPVWTSAVAAPIDVVVAAAALGLLVVACLPPIAVVGLCALAGQVLAAR